MGIPLRNEGDRILPMGAMASIRQRLRVLTQQEDISTVIACAFDYRTRMLPFFFADTHMIPASTQILASALLDSGFDKTRIVLKHWNKNFQPSQMRLDGKIPDIFMVSTMSLHTESARQMLRDIRKLPPETRPLVIVGGSACIYEPWVLFSNRPNDIYGGDLAITGEAYVLLQVLERALENKSKSESLRSAFIRLRDAGGVDDLPGLVYPRGENMDQQGPQQLVDTGIQRLCSNLDEMPYPDPALGVLNPPNRSSKLANQPLAANKVHKHSLLLSIIMTFGCKFSCSYCPIPLYNQKNYRTKTGERIAEEIRRLWKGYGIRTFFGCDDNFFNNHENTLAICETLARSEIDGKPLRRRARIATEVTVHDTLKMKEHLPLIRKAGVRSLWLGVEDLSGTLVNKGQSADLTTQAFQLLRSHGIMANPMMMHHDEQPLRSKGDNTGLLNQVKILKKAKSTTLQVLMITPSAGSNMYEPTFESGIVFKKVGKKVIPPHMLDGNYIVASKDPKPWRKQLNLLRAYLSFYNPIETIKRALDFKNKTYAPDLLTQFWGQWGLMHNIVHTLPWALRLRFAKIERFTSPPVPDVPIIGVDGNDAPHYQTPAEKPEK